jgi:hypothetical protein
VIDRYPTGIAKVPNELDTALTRHNAGSPKRVNQVLCGGSPPIGRELFIRPVDWTDPAQSVSVMDEHLVGLWSDRMLFPSDVESAELAFRADGTGWLYWSSWSGAFTVLRYTWAITAPGTLALKFHRTVEGTWTIDDGVTRHDVDSEAAKDSLVEVGYLIAPAEDPMGNPVNLLSLDRPLDDHLAGARFAHVERDPLIEPGADDPKRGPTSHH